MYIILYIYMYVVWYLLDLVLRPLRAESLMVSQWCVQEECVLADMYMYACWMCSSTLASASVVVTSDEAVRGGKTIPLKSIVDEAVEGCECVRKVFVSRRTGADVPMTQRDIQLEEVRNTTTTPTGWVDN